MSKKRHELPHRHAPEKNKPKGIAVNGIPIKRAVELFGILNIVFSLRKTLIL